MKIMGGGLILRGACRAVRSVDTNATACGHLRPFIAAPADVPADMPLNCARALRQEPRGTAFRRSARRSGRASGRLHGTVQRHCSENRAECLLLGNVSESCLFEQRDQLS